MTVSDDTRSFLPAATFVGWKLDDALAPDRCATILRDLAARGFERTGEHYPANYRDNDRLVFDDPELAKTLYRELRDRLPRTLDANGRPLANGDEHAEERWQLVGLNSHFRACRYQRGQAFCIHRDGPYVPDDKRRSFLTIQFYLDDDPARAGGHTRFYADPRGETTWASIAPSTGTAIVFDHRAWHDGEPVTAGIKHVLRTDAIYRRVGKPSRGLRRDRVELERADSLPNSVRVFGRHRGYVWQVVSHHGNITSAGRDGTVRFWPKEGKPHVEDLGRGSVTCLAPVEDRMWCGLRSGEVWLLDEAKSEVASGLGAITSAAVWPPTRDYFSRSTDESIVAFTTSRGELVAFDEETRAPAWTARAHDGWAWAIVSTEGGFVSCGHDGRVNRIDRAGRVRSIADLGFPVRAIASLERSMNEATIIAGDERGWLHWVADDGRVVRSHRAHAATVTSIATHGNHVISAGEDGVVTRWRDNGECDVVLLERDDFITSVATTREGNIITAGYDGALRLIDA